MTVREMLFENQDVKYGDFHSKLIPGIDREKIIGVRLPVIRKIAKKAAKAIIAAIKKVISLFIKIFGKYIIIIIVGALIIAAIWYAIQKANIKNTIKASKSSISNYLNGSTNPDDQGRRKY